MTDEQHTDQQTDRQLPSGFLHLPSRPTTKHPPRKAKVNIIHAFFSLCSCYAEDSSRRRRLHRVFRLKDREEFSHGKQCLNSSLSVFLG
ncbi:hypothetical protein QCA50_018962 [Cerrena zonata]|uniref:Uncharacterized protein n=1 Tax=Cerrena zonata TaxID=2478898 RepID=A0AAW0FD85_9APHY